MLEHAKNNREKCILWAREERKKHESSIFLQSSTTISLRKTLLFDSNIPSDIAILLKMLRVLFRRMRNSIYMQNVLFRERDRKNTRKFLIIYWSGSGFALFCIYSKEHFRFRQMMLRNKWCSWKKNDYETRAWVETQVEFFSYYILSSSTWGKSLHSSRQFGCFFVQFTLRISGPSMCTLYTSQI